MYATLVLLDVTKRDDDRRPLHTPAGTTTGVLFGSARMLSRSCALVSADTDPGNASVCPVARFLDSTLERVEQFVPAV